MERVVSRNMIIDPQEPPPEPKKRVRCDLMLMRVLRYIVSLDGVKVAKNYAKLVTELRPTATLPSPHMYVA